MTSPGEEPGFDKPAAGTGVQAALSNARVVAEALYGGLQALPVVGALASLLLPVLLPARCADSIVRDARLSGRGVAQVAMWAFAWPVALVVVLTMVTTLVVIVPQLGAALLLWLVGPIVVGGIVAMRARGLGGFGVGTIGLLAGGLLFAIATWLGLLIGRLSGGTTFPDAITALGLIPILTLMVPVLTAAQLGVGVIIVSMVRELSIHEPEGLATGATRSAGVDGTLRPVTLAGAFSSGPAEDAMAP